MTVLRPTLPAFSPGHATGYTVTAADYDNDTLQQGAWTQLMLGAQTSFPASPAAGDTCFRSDLNAWYQCTNATGPVWTQMSIGSFATTARPAAPPTGYVYYDTTITGLIRWNGAAYGAVLTTQDALTALTAGTNITIGITGFATSGSRVVIPTGGVYAIANLTATGAIAAGSVVATLAAGHRPPTTIGLPATKFTGGVLTSPVAAALLINGAGQIVTETALANTDTLVAALSFMTS